MLTNPHDAMLDNRSVGLRSN